ncbi:MAG: 16S rRNA (adenine(1518)-N(6)/adenine(1519)-N(6))-dimethyltransferase, partial [Paludibacteraceae bacterium]|nr:16S rRNA (adenine(1518)-N(6)/adenine(1519)-N(6))-dimethyltransferase [Paludibacteraceae bacterium]
VVKTAFNQRRKTLRNSLRSLLGENKNLMSEKIFDARPEQLSVEEFVRLTNLIAPFVVKIA